ncbi:phosphonate ABC transporter ATP-binding protein [Haloquadratum walsbyi]|jgi:ABC-type phosphate/phosphonate transport system, ATPase component|uniref:ABC-type phosphate/phosphonate transport system, ATPase component n=1 Tax=Haloquadratum walsbyi J07HQW2 TaxID=1238425 RepID=U1NF07_9EURY|nr:ATP-binding cassette domain-containing protein [Haloquadratum walsbyi]ERG95348.1 MAG: ABC-type phosphate/phosphonate transport system, ATPase component [Haloquadratum walsbyi J07HQW2]
MLDIENLTRRYGSETAVDGFSTRLVRGELTVLIGRSGAGKTTLLRCLDRLEQPTEGTIIIDDSPLTITDTALVFQSGALVEGKSALENVLDGALCRESVWRELIGWHSKTEKRTAITRLHDVGLAGYADRPVEDLSGGQQQRVGIARALQQQPDVVLADEPVASLDPETGQSVLSVLAEAVHNHNLIGLVSLHQPELATAVADHYLGMTDGRLVLDQPAAQVDRNDINRVYTNV